MLAVGRNIKVEQGKKYRVYLEGYSEHEYIFLSPITSTTLYPKTKNFRYTHYMNLWGANVNQFNVDYINDAIKYDDLIAISGVNNEVIYVKIIKIREIE